MPPVVFPLTLPSTIDAELDGDLLLFGATDDPSVEDAPREAEPFKLRQVVAGRARLDPARCGHGVRGHGSEPSSS